MTSRPSTARRRGMLRRVVGGLVAVTCLTLTGCQASTSGDGARNGGAVSATSASASSPASRGASSPGGSASVRSSSPGASDSSSSGADTDARATSGGRGDGPMYDVVSVVDGDTIKVRVDGVKTTVRLIGVDTPETHKPHVPVQCFGPQASSHMQSLVQSKQVQLVAEPNQGDKDKYGRLLRDVYVGGSTNVALSQIAGGFGREYTYAAPYRHRLDHLAAQNRAKAEHRGTWGPPCNGFHTGAAGAGAVSPSASPAASPRPTSTSASTDATTSTTGAAAPSRRSTPPLNDAAPGRCLIKGNISASGTKIAHAPGSATYARTRITPATGERYFCTAADAVAAGWRMAAD